MTHKIALFTDTASDILQFPNLFDEVQPQVIYQYINIGKESYTDENMTLDELLSRMESATKKNWPRTSQPPVADFVNSYMQLKEEGYTDVISVHVAGDLSGTINSARLAAQEIENLNVHIVDSRMASLGMIPCLIKAKSLIDKDMDPVEIQEQVNEYAKGLELFAAVPTLENLYKGGRLKPIRFFLGRLLKFKPIIRMHMSELGSVDKTRKLESTQEQAYLKAVAPYNLEDDFTLLVSHAWTEETALQYIERFKEEFPGKNVYLGRVGPSMAVHLGPGGLIFMAF